MLRSVRDLRRCRVKTAEERICGRIHDFYFDDRSWEIRHIVLTLEPRQFGQRQVLLDPAMIEGFCEDDSARLRISAERIFELPLASSVLPVCKQYAGFSYGSAGSRALRGGGNGASPHLRSADAVTHYKVEFAREFSGSLADFLVNDEGWVIRYLGLEHAFEKKNLRFFVVPQSVERISWAGQRVVLRKLQPVAVDVGERLVEVAEENVA